MRPDDGSRIADLVRRVAMLESMVARLPVTVPGLGLLPVKMAQVGGADGDDEDVATWTYNVTDFYDQAVFTGLDILVTSSPVVYKTQHIWRRPNLGSVAKATYGLLYRSPPNTDREATWTPWGLLWCNEVSVFEACA